jgi:hypothetical protein
MSEFELLRGLYVAPTPAGAYFAASSVTQEPARTSLCRLLAYSEFPVFDAALLSELTGVSDEQAALEHIYRLQALGLIHGLSTTRKQSTDNLEASLPSLLAELVGEGKALLADEQGFYLGCHGFHHETAEELAGLSADLSSLHSRHFALLEGHLGMRSSAWALINAGGMSTMGFWPLFIGKHRFVLIISGAPKLDQPAMLDLVWLLFRRYGVSAVV